MQFRPKTYAPLLVLLATMQLSAQTNRFAIAIHGGAGTIEKSNMTPALEKQYRKELESALQTGYGLLEAGGSALDAVVSVIATLEDSPLFNAGKGAVFTSDGHHELDAAIMDGKTLNAGAVAAVKRIKNPILLARAVMDKSPHVMLMGNGAETFAREQGFSFVENDYFYTEKRFKYWQKVKEGATGEAEKHGTVGCVALDKNGNLAAGTSTGGTTNKRFGRVGDSPIIGAGTYASNATCAVSATGHGEDFIRAVVAYQIGARMAWQGQSLEKAATTTIQEDLTKIGGSGGVIAMDNNGTIAMPFNTSGMYRGYVNTDGKMEILIYKDE